MTFYEIGLFAAVLAIAVFFAYKLTKPSCKWFGHTWIRANAWNRTYICHVCGERRETKP